MKNLSLMKKVITITTVLIALLLLAQTALTFIPYFTITPLPGLLNPNPVPQEYSLFDLCWVDTLTITGSFSKSFQDLGLKDFKINDHVIMPVLTLVLGLAMIVTGIVYIKDVLKEYPSVVSGTLLHLFSLVWVPCAIAGYTGATILYIDQFVKGLNVILPSAHMVRSTSVILIVATSVLVALRLAAWIVDLIQEKKARAARIAAEEAAAKA